MVIMKVNRLILKAENQRNEIFMFRVFTGVPDSINESNNCEFTNIFQKIS